MRVQVGLRERGIPVSSLPDGSIVLMGGYAFEGYKNDVWRSMNYGATWTRINASAGWSGRKEHTSIVLPDGSIVLMGGYALGEGYKNDVWRSTNYGATWVRMNASAGWSGREEHTSVVLSDGSIVLMGGRGQNDVWRSTDYGATWTLMKETAEWFGRNGETSVVMPDGSIVLMGGSGYNDVWRLISASSSVRNPSHTYSGTGYLPGDTPELTIVAGTQV